MTEVCCKRCGAADYVKNGIVRGFQRYRCRSCGCNFTQTPARGKPEWMKALALLMYGMGNMGYRMIARILGVSHVSVYDWIREEATKLPEPEISGETVILTLDEMWHFLKKKLINSGFGGPSLAIYRNSEIATTLSIGEPSPGLLVAVMTPLAKNSSTKSASRTRRSSPVLGPRSEDWDGYHRLIPENQLFTGKDLTYPIEQDNSNIRHFLARFRRGAKSLPPRRRGSYPNA